MSRAVNARADDCLDGGASVYAASSPPAGDRRVQESQPVRSGGPVRIAPARSTRPVASPKTRRSAPDRTSSPPKSRKFVPWSRLTDSAGAGTNGSATANRTAGATHVRRDHPRSRRSSRSKLTHNVLSLSPLTEPLGAQQKQGHSVMRSPCEPAKGIRRPRTRWGELGAKPAESAI